MRAIFTPDALAPVGPYSQAVFAGKTLYVSGQTPLDPVTGEIPESIAAQTELTLKNLFAILAAAGLDASNVVKTTCYLTTMDHFAAFNAVYAKHFTAPLPARTTVAVRALPRDVLVEIDAIAATE